MKRHTVAFLLALGGGMALSGSALAGPDLPDPPQPGHHPKLPDPPGPGPRPPSPGELPGIDDDHPWWDPLGLFHDHDKHRGHGHDKHDGKKHKHHKKHDD